MTVTTTRLTFAEYLAYEDGTDNCYELVNGALIAVVLGTGLHGEIMHFAEKRLTAEIERMGQSLIARQAAVGVRSPRSGRWDTCRIPDLVVLPEDQWLMLRGREAVIEMNEPAPKLVVEVVSESTKGTDYRAKEYAD
jgi:Uma2 family endonuclease